MFQLRSRINGRDLNRGGVGGGGWENTEKEIKRGGREKQGGGGGGIHFCLILQLPFSGSKTIFFVIKQTSSHPVCLPLHQCYFQIIMSLHFFPIFITCNVCF